MRKYCKFKYNRPLTRSAFKINSMAIQGIISYHVISCQAAALRACTSDCWRLDRSVNLHHKRFHWAKQKAIVCVSTQVPPVGHSS